MRLLKIILMVLSLVCWGIGCSEKQKDFKPTGPLSGRSDPRYKKAMDLSRKHFWPEIALSPSQLTDLAELNTNVAQVLRTHDTSLLRTCVFTVTNHFQNVWKWDRPQYVNMLDSHYHKEILESRQLESAKTANELEQLLSFDFELTVLLGQSLLRVDPSGRGVISMDDVFYRRLMQCKDYYRSAGKTALVVVVDRWIMRWLDYVESDIGVNRTAAHRRFAFELECAREIGNTTPDNALALARVYARGLVCSGYTPRWLDHDFPLPAKTTTGKEEESSSKTRGHTPSVKK